jgi:2-hydroxychromene-2-carboxylate isomerase
MEERVLSAFDRLMVTVRCYADPVSPYAWLGLRDLGRIEAAGARVVVTPVLFAGLLDAHGNLGPAEVPAKRRYLFRDVMREAARRGLPFAGPPGHPFNPLPALRMCMALADDASRSALLMAFTCATWERGADLKDMATLVRLADGAGLDGTGLWTAAQTPAVKQALADATAQAAADGVFGVPTFRLDGDDELFWGADRIDALLWRMQGHAIDEEALREFAAREPLAQRKR